MGKFAWTGVMAAMVMAGPAWSAPTASTLIAETQAALDVGDAQHATNLADEALKDDEVSQAERGCLVFYRGLAEELLGSREAAMRDFTTALDISALPATEREHALLQRGFLRDGLGQLDQAATDYSAVIALNGDSLATALDDRANIYRRQKRFRDAQRDYQTALSVEGAKPQYAWYGLGQVAEAQGDPFLARELYAKAVAADPGNALASERLKALGGPPDRVLANLQDRIVLHPPKPAPAIEAVLKVTREATGTIVLQAPESAAPAAVLPIALHPPGHEMPNQAGPSLAAQPARKISVVEPVLRPALDQGGATARSAGSGQEVQLGAWRSEGEANAGWNEAKSRAGGALDGLSHHIVTADLPGKGRYYRLRVAITGQSGIAFCADLSAKGVACLPTRD
jgi:tetratricopeptide (TPR) repeat protein